MPKTPSRTSKKKKYNSRFPPARIKKIMQTDEDVGKVAAAVPIIISRALELFIESLITETSQTTMAKNAKTLSTSHIKQTIHSNKQFDFLRDLVANVPDHNTEESIGNDSGNGVSEAAQDNGDIPQKKKRGRPRKMKEAPVPERKKRGESSKTSPEASEGEEEEDDEDEENESENDDKAPNSPETSKSSSVSSSSVSYSASNCNSGPSPITTAGPHAYPAQFPPGYSVPAIASLTNQQQQLQQLPQQMIAHHQPPPQQQPSMGSAPSSSATLSHPYLPPATLSTHNPAPLTASAHPSGRMDVYPIPPQFHHNPYHQMPTQMMPPAHQPMHQHSLPPGVPSVYPGYPGPAHLMSGPRHVTSNSQAQAHPINLSMSCQRGPPPPDQRDDYDS